MNNNKQAEIDLLPCPFCGCSDIGVAGHAHAAYAHCRTCCTEGPIGDFTDEQAIAALEPPPRSARLRRDPVTKQLEILWHALGVTPEKRTPYRGHFVTGAGSDDHYTCSALVLLGMMRACGASPITGGEDLFLVTDAGRTFALDSLPDPPNLTRSQKRYMAFLAADTSMTFGRWLGAKTKPDAFDSLEPYA